MTQNPQQFAMPFVRDMSARANAFNFEGGC